MSGSSDKPRSTAICARTEVYTCAHIHKKRFSEISMKQFVFLPEAKLTQKNHLLGAASLTVVMGQVRSFKVHLNPWGYVIPPKTEGRSWRGIVHMESVTYWLLWWSYCVPYGSV